MRIGLVNDMPLALEALRRCLALKPEHEIAWVARDGAEAVARCAEDAPDLVLLDLLMPHMGGVEAAQRIMAATPCAILIVTADVGANASYVFEAMGHGALDAIDTPRIGQSDLRAAAAPLLAKIDAIERLLRDRSAAHAHDEPGAELFPASVSTQLVAIGASAGGPAAVMTVLRGLPKDFAGAVVIVQHVDQQFAAGMADWLSQDSPLPVRLAEEGTRPTCGSAWLAGTNHHLEFKSSGQLGYTPEPRDCAYRPSVDVFFQSVSRHWRGTAAGVLLTGMGKDGAKGLKAMRDKGHYTIAQDRFTSAVYGMPKAAAELHAAVDVLPVERIAARLRSYFEKS